jgi:hypothetical protein
MLRILRSQLRAYKLDDVFDGMCGLPSLLSISSKEASPMMRLSLIAVLASSMCLAACSSFPSLSWNTAQPVAPAPVKAKKVEASDDRVTIEDEEGTVEVQKVEFHPGVSSATVERLARRFGCTGSSGAGLVTEKGPVEVYRMSCDNGTTFMAQCELRQCRPMR